MLNLTFIEGFQCPLCGKWHSLDGEKLLSYDSSHPYKYSCNHVSFSFWFAYNFFNLKIDSQCCAEHCFNDLPTPCYVIKKEPFNDSYYSFDLDKYPIVLDDKFNSIIQFPFLFISWHTCQDCSYNHRIFCNNCLLWNTFKSQQDKDKKSISSYLKFKFKLKLKLN